MAKLGSFYSLCPLVDNRTLLHVSEDSEEGIVIVTLGKNLSSRYKLSDQKQLTSWRTKEKFSSPVLYHNDKKQYVAAFNQLYVKYWNEDDNLDKIKKYKFNRPINTLIKVDKCIFIVFENGGIYELDKAVEERKTLIPDGLDVKQIDCILHSKVGDTFYIGLVSNNVLYWTKINETRLKYYEVILEKNELGVKGFVFHNMRDAVYLLTLWSDGSMLSLQLDDTTRSDSPTKSDLGQLYAIVDSLSCKHNVSMKSLDDNYVCLYGANNNDEGAMLVLYNVQFKVTQSKQPFKLYANASRIWRIAGNLFVPVGQNLAVIPFRLETEQLAALVGSHKDSDTDVRIVNELEIASWAGKNGNNKRLPDTLKAAIEPYLKQGVTESVIIDELLPGVLDSNDLTLLQLILTHFTDIPDKSLVTVLIYGIKSDNSKIICSILRKSFSDVLILPHLRNDLNLDDISYILNFMYDFWVKNRVLSGSNYVETHAQLVRWCCVIIDSGYQKIVVSRDEKLIDVLDKLLKLVDEYLATLDKMRDVVPLLYNVKNSRKVDACLNVDNLKYRIERIELF